jgi:hypothetical protein
MSARTSLGNIRLRQGQVENACDKTALPDPGRRSAEYRCALPRRGGCCACGAMTNFEYARSGEEVASRDHQYAVIVVAR